MPSPALVRTTWVGHSVPSSTATKCTGPTPGTGTATNPVRGRAVLLTTMVDEGGASTVGRELPQRVARERLADVASLLVAHPHRFHDFVVAARAGRIVGAVEDEVTPADVEQRAGVRVAFEEQRAQRFGEALEAAFGARGGLVDVDPIRRHPHEHVGACA